ncbi:MAG: signal recognition particle receptor subunit alpha, partial [Pseudomonadota bacterium]
MAGFLKRIFSFGRKKVEETPAEGDSTPEALIETVEESVAEDAVAETSATQPDDEPLVEPVVEEPRVEADEEPALAAIAEGASAEPTEEPLVEAAVEEAPAAPVLEPEPEEAAVEPAEEPEAKALEPQAPAVEVEAEPEPDNQPETAPMAEDDAPTAVPEPVEPAPSDGGDAGKVVIGDEPPREEIAEEQPVEPSGWFARMRAGLSRSSRQLTENIAGVFTKRKLDDETLEELEDILIQADLGIETAMRITDSLSSGRYGRDVSTDEVRKVMADEIVSVLDPVAKPLELDLSHKPHVLLVVGVNGSGKTTTIGKLAAKLRDAGLKVTLGAGDTFRAAAIEQLKIWANRTGSTFVGTKLGADAAGLAFSAYETARDNGSDVVIIDTAGRLQNKTELMDELAKIVRVLQKHDPEAPHTVLQTLDATTGQNA